MMGAVFIASLVGLILESVRGKVELPSAGDVAQAVSAMIYGIKGEYAGAEAAVGNGIVIGRDPAACQLVLNKDKVSRRHCKIAYNPANNTYVEPIIPAMEPIYPGRQCRKINRQKYLPER